MALDNVGVSEQEQKTVLGGFRDKYYAEINNGLSVEKIKIQDIQT
jgi:hypothetical protein